MSKGDSTNGTDNSAPQQDGGEQPATEGGEAGAKPSAAEQSPGILREFLSFLLHEKKWWLIPLIVILLLLVGLMFMLESSSIAPFIYPLH